MFMLRALKTSYRTGTKEESADGNPLKDQVWKVIDNNVTLYQSNKAAKIEVDVLKFSSMSDEEKINAIEMVLNRSIRTNLAQDGGGVEVKGIEGNNVRIHYQGACGSCPTSTTGTLQYIQTQLKQQLHQDLTVQSV